MTKTGAMVMIVEVEPYPTAERRVIQESIPLRSERAMERQVEDSTRAFEVRGYARIPGGEAAGEVRFRDADRTRGWTFILRAVPYTGVSRLTNGPPKAYVSITVTDVGGDTTYRSVSRADDPDAYVRGVQGAFLSSGFEEEEEDPEAETFRDPASGRFFTVRVTRV